MKGIMRLDGLEQYLEKIAQAGEDIDAAADRAVEAGAGVVFEDMLARVPVDTGALKVHLSENGMSLLTREGNARWITVGLFDLGGIKGNYGNTGKRSGRKQYPREFLYGVILEYGRSNMAAQPYVRPAFDSNRAKVKAAEIAALKESGIFK